MEAAVAGVKRQRDEEAGETEAKRARVDGTV
jgi:hypothetical protein